VLPDTDRLISSLQDSFDELLTLASVRAATAASRLPTRPASHPHAGHNGRASHAVAG
jgi:hypothetical protein